MSNEPEGQDGQKWVEVELKSTGQKVAVPPQLVEHIKTLDGAGLKELDYRQKTQALADGQRKVLEERSELATAREQLNAIERDPAKKAAFDALTTNPGAFRPAASAPAGAGEQDPFADTPNQAPGTAVDPQARAAIAQGQAILQQLTDQMTKSNRQRALNSANAELKRAFPEESYIDPEVVQAELAASPHLWNRPIEEQVSSVVHGLHGPKLLQRSYERGQADYQRKLDEDAQEKAEAEAVAANSPTQVTMPSGEVITNISTKELNRLLHEDRPRYDAIMAQMHTALKGRDAATAQQRWDTFVRPV